MGRYSGVILAILGLFFMAGCRFTRVDDPGNFERIFLFEKPPEVQVVHSYYHKNPDWLPPTDPRYYIELRGMGNSSSDPTKWGTLKAATPTDADRKQCGQEPPDWFVPKAVSHYQMWIPIKERPEDNIGLREFRDKDDGTLFYCLGKP
jgi:hypothetical protein